MQSLTKLIQTFPNKGAGLDGLKLMAAIIMVLDHVNTIFLDLHPAIWMVGRVVFPAFALVAAIHVERGVDPGRYLLKLLPFAVLSQIPYLWAFWEPLFNQELSQIVLNIIFTLGGGVVFACFARRLERYRWFLPALVFVGFIYWVFMPHKILEYGIWGLFLPYAFTLVMRGEKGGLCFVVLCCLFMNADYAGLASVAEAPLEIVILLGSFMVMMVTIWALGHMILTIAYSYETMDRFLPRYFFHIFYPLHLFVLAALDWML